MRILIAGGAGFIGSNLCIKLIENNHDIICLDNNSSGMLSNIEYLLNNKNFTYIEHDILNPIEYDFVKLDQVYNLACPASPKDYQSDPINTIKINTIGIINLLDLCVKYKCKYLFTSTSEIYGEPLTSPQSEKYRGNVNTTGIRSCYDEGKRIGETLAFEYKRKYKIDIKIARIFNTYGPNMRKDDGRVISNFIWKAINDKPLIIYGNGSQSRSFCYVDDTINGLIKLMDSNLNCPVNIGNPNELSILDIAKKIIFLLNKNKYDFKFIELPEDDPTNRNPDIKLAKDELKWLPTINLENGLLKTIEYFKKIQLFHS